MIKRITAKSYRCFKSLDLELEQYHVLVGANGSGKSTLLDLLSVFGDLLLTRSVSEAFFSITPTRKQARASKSSELIHNSEGDEFTIGIEVELPQEIRRLLNPTARAKGAKSPSGYRSVRYSVTLEDFNGMLQISYESLVLVSARKAILKRPPVRRVIEREEGSITFVTSEPPVAEGEERQKFEFTIPTDQLALKSIPADDRLFPAANWLRTFLVDQIVFFSPDYAAMRKPSSPLHKSILKSDGSSLPWQVLRLSGAKKKDDYAEWLATVRQALPAVQTVSATSRPDDNHAFVQVEYRSGLTVPASGLSEGTLHLLAMTLLPHTQPCPGVIYIEEPENGTHPKAIEVMLEAFQGTFGSQILISTHSPVVLAHTKLEHVLCLRMGNTGAVDVVVGTDHPRLSEWKGEVDLGVLFAAGVLE